MSVWVCYISWYVYQIRFRNYDSNYSFSVFKSWSILSKYLWTAIFESQQQVYVLCKVWPGLWVGPSLTIRLFFKPNLVFVCPEGRIYGVLLKCLSSWEDFWSSVRAHSGKVWIHSLIRHPRSLVPSNVFDSYRGHCSPRNTFIHKPCPTLSKFICWLLQ